MKYYSDTFLRSEILALVKKYLSQKNAAKFLKISPQYLCDILICRREISESLAKKLGFKRTIVFQKIEDSHDRL